MNRLLRPSKVQGIYSRGPAIPSDPGMAPQPIIDTITTSSSKDAPASYCIAIVIDDSLSMTESDRREAQMAVSRIVEVLHNEHELNVFFLNHISEGSSEGKANGGYYNIGNASQIVEVFGAVRNTNGTPNGTRLNEILAPHITKCEQDITKAESMIVIVITDGLLTVDPGSNITPTAEKLNDLNAPSTQVSFQFFQVGQTPFDKSALDALLNLNDIRNMIRINMCENDKAGELDLDHRIIDMLQILDL